MARKYSIDGGDWRKSIELAKLMDPKPAIIVEIDKNIYNNNAVLDNLNEIADIYRCASYKCFYIGA